MIADRFGQIFLLGNFLLSFAQSQRCSNTCTDYNRLCPGLKDSGFFARYQADIASGAVGVFQANTFPEPDCSNGIYRYVCPQTCGICTPCSVSKINAAQVKISSLEDQVMILSETLKEFNVRMKDLASGITVTVSKIPIKSATASEIYSNQMTVAKSHDGGVRTDIEFCFHAKASTNGWAEYQIPPSKVFKVGVLNRKGAAHRLEGSRVEVCSLRGGCSVQCGVFPDVPESQWGYVDCPEGGLEGSYVRITNPREFLQICEMDIQGALLTNPRMKSTGILSATSSPQYNNEYTLAESYDGGFKTNIDFCFHSLATANGHAEYQINPATVKFVGVLNRESPESAKRLKGSRVEVCQQSGGCNTVCGVFPDVPASSWGYVECQGAGVPGSYVRVVNPGNFLQICEIDIVVAS